MMPNIKWLPMRKGMEWLSAIRPFSASVAGPCAHSLCIASAGKIRTPGLCSEQMNPSCGLIYVNSVRAKIAVHHAYLELPRP